jgi:hypothetical protein
LRKIASWPVTTKSPQNIPVIISDAATPDDAPMLFPWVRIGALQWQRKSAGCAAVAGASY